MELEAEFDREERPDERVVHMLINGMRNAHWSSRYDPYKKFPGSVSQRLCQEELNRWTAELEAAQSNPKHVASLQERIDRQRTHIEKLELALDQRNEEIARLRADNTKWDGHGWHGPYKEARDEVLRLKATISKMETTARPAFEASCEWCADCGEGVRLHEADDGFYLEPPSDGRTYRLSQESAAELAWALLKPRPIETVTEGEFVLGWDKHAKAWCKGYYLQDSTRFTHWLPLPPAPEAPNG